MEIIRPQSKQPIPDHARKVFTGKIFDVYQWEQELFDGSTATFEKLKRADTVVVFPVLPDGRIILTEQEQPGKEPFMGATGGRVEVDEDVLIAAKRELLEESGYTAERFILWDAQHPTSKVDWVVYTFVAKGLQKISDPNPDSGEKIKLMPVSFEELLQLVVDPRFIEKEVVPKVFEARLDEGKKKELQHLFDPNT
jgi:ADP-ribose pyrophosphatase